jgi:hypothetical protein
MLHRVLCTLLCLAWTANLAAQEIRGTIMGFITDPAGAAVPAARVLVTSQSTNVSNSYETNQEGRYVAPFLPPGSYSIRVEKEGFSTVIRENVLLQTQDRLTVDFVMKLGALAETVKVTAQSPILQMSSADFGQVVSNSFVNRLPVVAVSPLSLADMAPGVVPSAPDNNVSSLQAAYVQINGSAGPGNQIAIDGAPVEVPRQQGTTFIIPMAEMVEELKVVTTLFDAAQGRTSGGSMFVSTRSGSNRYRGSAYYHIRDERFNANSWTNNYFRNPRGQINFVTMGGIIGGPIRKDKTFFNIGMEYLENRRLGTFQFRVPTALERRGNFSQSLSPQARPLELYDPHTTVIDSAGRFVSRVPYPNAILPASQHNPTGLAIAAAYPLPNFLDRPNQISQINHIARTPVTTDNFNIQTRLDHVLNARHRLYGRYARNRGGVNLFHEPAAFPGYWASSGVNTDNRLATNYVIEDTMTLSPSLVGSIRAGFNRFTQPTSGSGDRLDPDILKLPQILKQSLYSGGSAGGGWPRIDISDGNVASLGPQFRIDVNNIISLTSTFNKFWGKHNLRWGGDYRHTRWFNNNAGSAQNGQFIFDKPLTRARDDASANVTSGSGMASLILGYPTAGEIRRIPALSIQDQYGALYVQDDYRILPKLTLSFGLRYEVETPFTERYDRLMYGFDRNANVGLTVPGIGPLRGGILFVNENGLPRRQGAIDANNLGPRLSAAYAWNEKTVIRGGWVQLYQGLSYAEGNPSAPDTFTFATPYQGSGDGNRTLLPGVSISNPFPSGFQAVTGTSLGLRSQLGNTVSFLEPDRKIPNIQQTQVSVQRALPWNSVLEVAYVGVRYNSLWRNYNLNEVPDAFRTQDNTVANPFRGVLPATSTRGAAANIAANQLRTQFPQFTTVTQRNMNGPWGRYHSLQSRWEKRMSDGVQFVANYTYSKNLLHDPQSVVNDRFYKSVTDNDRTHVARLFLTADLPFGRRQKFGRSWPRWLDGIAGGWAVTWVTRYASGAALSLSGPNGRPIPIANPRTNVRYRNCLGDPAGARPETPCLDVTLVTPLVSRFDITPEPVRYAWLRGPGYADQDAVLFKTVNIWERLRFELRAEVNNVTNTPQWSDPRTDIANPRTFGTIIGGGNPRSVRFTARLHF